MLRRFFSALAAFFILLSLACGGGGGDEEFETLEFEEVPPSPTAPVEEVVQRVGLDPEVVVRLRFLYGHQVRLAELTRLSRDLVDLVEYGSPASVNLSWVVQVHEVTQEMDDFAKRASDAGIPESQRSQYEYLFVGLLEAVDIIGYGSLRLLEGATIIGPSGRTMETLDPAARERFLIRMGEAAYFFSEGQAMVKKESSAVGAAIGRVGVR